MITIQQIEQKIIDRRAEVIKGYEDYIDNVLESEWERGQRKINVPIPESTHRLPDEQRLIVDKLITNYRAGNQWLVKPRSSRHDNVYDTLEFSPYTPPSSSGRD